MTCGIHFVDAQTEEEARQVARIRERENLGPSAIMITNVLRVDMLDGDLFSRHNPNITFDSESAREDYDSGVGLMTQLAEQSSSLDRNFVAGLTDGFMMAHRTNQQAMMRAFMHMLRQWACGKKEDRVDARNEASWNLAKKILEIDLYLPHI